MFNFIARMSLDATGYVIGMKRAEGAAESAARGIKSKLAQAFGASAVIAFARSAIQSADAIGDLADQYGRTVDEIQRLNSLALTQGITSQDVLTAFGAMAKARQEALDGNKDMIASFEKLGLTLQDIANLSDEMKLAEAIGSRIGALSGIDQTSVLKSIAGRGGSKMRSVLSGLGAGSEGTMTMRLTADEQKKASEFADSMAGFWEDLKILGAKVIAKAMPKESEDIRRINERLAKSQKEKAESLVKSGQIEIRKIPTLDSLKEEKKIADEIFKLEFERLSYAEKRESLQKRIAGWMAIEADQAGTPEADIAKLNRLRAENELAQLSAPRLENISGNLTELQKIGAQVSESNAAMSILRDQLAVQKQIAANTKPGQTGEGGFE